MTRPTCFASLLGAFLALTVLRCAAPSSSPPHSVEWDGFVADYIEAYLIANPTVAVRAGRHEFDGQLPDWSPEGLANEESRLREARDQALAFDETLLSEDQRFERRYLISRIEQGLFWRVEAERPQRNPRFYSGPLSPSVYLTRDYAPLADRMTAFTTYLQNVPRAVEQIQTNLRTPMSRPHIQIGVNVFGGLVRYFRDDVPTIFESVEDPEKQDAYREANESAVRSLQQFVEWLKAQEENATNDFALGAERFAAMLRQTEGVDVPLARLKEIGETDLDRNLSALKEACAKLSPGEPIEACAALVAARKPELGPVEGARNQLTDLKQFLIDKDIVTIPSDEEALVDEAPPYRRFNLAYIEIPGTYEEDLPSVYYIAPPDPSWSEEERGAYVPGVADLLFVSVHEVWPGHFLNSLHRALAPSEFARLSGSYAFGEGWAHYTEEMMLEAGLGEGDLEVQVGQLLNALFRNVRFLSAIGLHAEGMTVEESERMFREKAFTDPGNARQQAARGTYDPAYLNYTLGKLMIRKLRDDWTADRGGREAWRAFHDEFLSYGRPPIPLVREAMLGTAEGLLQ